MENNEEKCAWCGEKLRHGAGQTYNGHDQGQFHVECHSLVSTITDMNKEGLVRILNLINNIQKQQS